MCGCCLRCEAYRSVATVWVRTLIVLAALEENHGKDDADVKAAMMREPANFPNVKVTHPFT